MHGNKGKKQSKEHIAKRLANQSTWKKGKYWLGKKHTKLEKEKISITKKKSVSTPRGINHHNWKGGITSIVEQLRKCFKYRQWRSDVFSRDNFTCVLCYKKASGILEADHFPKKFSEILSEYKINTYEKGINCEELWSINNGRTLCEECHIKSHKITHT